MRLNLKPAKTMISVGFGNSGDGFWVYLPWFMTWTSLNDPSNPRGFLGTFGTFQWKITEPFPTFLGPRQVSFLQNLWIQSVLSSGRQALEAQRKRLLGAASPKEPRHAGTVPADNQTWLAGKWTIEISDFQLFLLKPPFSSGIFRLAMFDYQRVTFLMAWCMLLVRVYTLSVSKAFPEGKFAGL